MKRAVVVLVGLFLLIGGVAYADDGGMFNWHDPCGYTCYQWADGSGDCYPCVECEVCTQCTPVPPETPTKEPTPPPPTETPEPKPKCNRGLGNGSEDCDPGNSGGKPGAAGEDNE